MTVLLINNFWNLIVKGDIYSEYIKHFYYSFYVIKESTNSKIDVLEDTEIQYNEFWEKESFFYDYVVETDFVKTNEVNFAIYDLIICHRHCRREIDNHLISKATVLYFDEVFRNEGMLFGRLMLKERGKETFIEQELKSTFVTNFEKNKGFCLNDQEDYFIREIAGIKRVNMLRNGKACKKILILDDQIRPFFIGDSYMWMVFLKKFILSFIDYEDVVINCAQREKFLILNNIFKGSFPKSVMFTNLDWEEIDFEYFNLILCQVDSELKFLSYYSFNQSLFVNTSIFTFDACDPVKENDRYNWDYSKINAVNLSGGHLNKHRYNIQRELKITLEERIKADEWLFLKGVEADEHLIILVVEASNQIKVLSLETCIELITVFLHDPKCKVLLFESSVDSMVPSILSTISSSLRKRIIVSSNRGIRVDMGLLASKYVRAIIGPCTGLIHLASGIHHYLTYKNEKVNRPLILVYTGKITEFYNPVSWWKASNVDCAIISYDSKGNKRMISLEECPVDIESYNKLSLPVSEINCSLLFEYIDNRYLELNFAKAIE